MVICKFTERTYICVVMRPATAVKIRKLFCNITENITKRFTFPTFIMEITIGKRIRQLREAKGLTVADFAKCAGVKPSAIYGLEGDANKPSIETVAMLRQSFPDLNTEWLQFGEGDMFKDGRALTPADQLPPQVPSKLEPPQAPARPVLPTPDEWRENMRVVAESAELREVKSERDNLRELNAQLVAIIKSFTGGATDSASVGKTEASSEAAGLRELVDEVAEEYPLAYRIAAVRPIGFQASHLRIA